MLPVTTIPGNRSPLGNGTRKGSSLSPRGKHKMEKWVGPPRCHQLSRGRILILPALSASPLSAQQAGCAWLHAYVGACLAQGALAASRLFQANGRTLRWSTLGPIIGGDISLMDRETACLAPFHWFSPTKGSLDFQPMLSHQPTGVCSAAGSCFPLRLIGSLAQGLPYLPIVNPDWKFFLWSTERISNGT